MDQSEQTDDDSLSSSDDKSDSSVSNSQELSSETKASSHSSSIVSQIELRPKSDPHKHHLPLGWTCEYDRSTDEYRFELESRSELMRETRDEAMTAITPTIDHQVQTSRRPTLNLFECKYGYHFPTSPTPSMISELAKQVQKDSSNLASTQPKSSGYNKSKITTTLEDESQAKRLKEMFPTATEPIIEQMIKAYNGREGLIKAALISFGYKRAKEYDAQKEPAQTPIMLMMAKPSSKKLFDKLVSYFPSKDETTIKNLMFQHKEVEYEIISKLVESSTSESDHVSRHGRILGRKDLKKLDKNGVIMKLRYLKFLYPTCEEIELYHLLNCNDLNAQKVMEEVEKKGHRKANIDEVLQVRKSQVQKMRAHQASQMTKEKTLDKDFLEAHKNRVKPSIDASRTNTLIEQLKKKFEHLDDELLRQALIAADYNEPLASKFLEEMEPIDESAYKQGYKIQLDIEPDVVRYPCKGVQKDFSNYMSVTGNEYVCIPREIVECETALALLKVDASTFTREDFAKPRKTQRQGAKLGLACGSIFSQLEPELTSRQGHNSKLITGSQYREFCAKSDRSKPGALMTGRNLGLSTGSDLALRFGRNLKLLERAHPFFEDIKA